jgi:transposase
MLGRRSGQGDLYRPDHTLRGHVGEGSFYGLLASRGAEWFRDEDFEALYRPEFGRPSVPPSQLCIALLLQTHDGVSDEEAIERSAYDLRWKVALGLDLEEKLCAKSTLQRFRAKLVLHEAFGTVFEGSVKACREAGLLGRKKLSVAIDTTPILGRGAVKDTYNLVSDAIRGLLEEICIVKGWELADVVEEQGLGRHFASSFKGSVELDWSDGKERRALVGQLVADARVALALAVQALRGFAKTAKHTEELRKARALLADLLAQDIDEEPEDGQGPQIRRGTARDRILSTRDPEMRHGRKSHSKTFDGYKASIVAETTSGVILATDIRAGNVPDSEGAAQLVTQAAECAEQDVDCMLGDTAYGNMETRAEIEALGVEVVAKVPPGTRKGMFGLEDFRVEKTRGVAHCPAGKRSRRRDEMRGADPGWRYIFSRKDCGPCPLRKQCTKGTKAARVLQITRKTEALQPLRRRQKTKRFRKRYRKRVVAEHRIARMVQLGVRQARYMGSKKVSFQVALTATVANLGLLLGLSPALIALLALVLLAGAVRASLAAARPGHSPTFELEAFVSETAPFRPDF